MAFDAVIGATQNAYITVAEGDTYHSERLHNAEWDNSGQEEKEQAIVWASRTLDSRMDWLGTPADTDNGLRFPRSGVYDRDGTQFPSDEIPQFLKDAVAEMAWELIKSDVFQNTDSFGIRKISAGEVATSFTGEQPTRMPYEVNRMLSYYVEAGSIGSYTILWKA